MSRPIDGLDARGMAEINSAFRWASATADGKGRLVGNLDGRVYPIPHSLVTLADHGFGLANKSIIEYGCYEGAHTIALAQKASKVTAIDARPLNLCATMLRCGWYGVSNVRFRCLDLEKDPELPTGDIVFHSGVLYHLSDPAWHLQQVAKTAREAVLLDVNHARETTRNATYFSRDQECYRVFRNVEGGRHAAKSGMADFAHWMMIEDMVLILNRHFLKIEVLNDRDEKNAAGSFPRVTILAWEPR